jgi:hypothetical protein
VTLPRFFTTGARFYKGQTGGFLGPEFDCFALNESKTDSLGDKDLAVNSLDPVAGIDANRMRSRRDLMERLDRLTDEQLKGPIINQSQKYRDKAFSMVSSGEAKKAFDLERESPKLRDRYGRNEYGQSFLMARRLVESGVRMVNVFWTFYGKDGCQFNLWDNHGSDKEVCGGYNKGFDMITAPYCCPSFDKAYSALLDDLSQRGLRHGQARHARRPWRDHLPRLWHSTRDPHLRSGGSTVARDARDASHGFVLKAHAPLDARPATVYFPMVTRVWERGDVCSLSCRFHSRSAEKSLTGKIMEKYEQLKTLVADLADDFDKFYGKSNNAAGTRIRKGMQAVKALAQDIRTDVQGKKQAD